jgi:hypothetical protein
MKTVPHHFIDEPVEVFFDEAPALKKKPSCPSAFRWRGTYYSIKEILVEWQDFSRRGRMAKNMIPERIKIARIKGSWGVGRFHFIVLVNSGRIFQIYYDRAPKNVDNRQGGWFLLGERKPAE